MNDKIFENLIIEMNNEGNYAIISINRPDKLNALDTQTLKEIADALEPMELDDKIRCVVIRGTKEYTKKPAFSAGADLSSRLPPNIDMNNLRHLTHMMYIRHKYYDLIEAFPKPIIAAVDGFALGGGLELVLVCDIVIATSRSTFGLPEINRGIFPANGGTQRLIRSIGLMQVKKMMYFGEHYTAKQMYDCGLVAYLVSENEFENIVHNKASLLGNSATNSLFVIKKCIQYGSQVPLEVGLQFEQLGYGLNSQSLDVKEGVSAFLEKRKAVFKGK
jgi:enoyl-CoA hydratase/carnithine racemase